MPSCFSNIAACFITSQSLEDPITTPTCGVFIMPILAMRKAAFYRGDCLQCRRAIPDDIMPASLQTLILLSCSNVFMTFAWYAHLKDMNNKPWMVAALASWGIALFEYLLQVPANRIGYTVMSLPQLKIMQEVIALSVFMPFAVFYMKVELRWDFLWASLCMVGAVYFMFRSH
jgi:uncharacterized protein (DUF486 family)